MPWVRLDEVDSHLGGRTVPVNTNLTWNPSRNVENSASFPAHNVATSAIGFCAPGPGKSANSDILDASKREGDRTQAAK